MKYMDIDCYERGCACASSSRVAGDDAEVVEVVRLRELSDEEIDKLKAEYTKLPQKPWSGIPMAHFDLYGFARAILKKASEK